MTYAIYYEFSSQEQVRQTIFAPAVQVSSELLLPVLWYRTVSPEKPRRTWSRISRSGYKPFRSGTGLSTVAEPLAHELTQLEGLSSHMKEILTDPSYELVVAFPVLLTDSILLGMVEAQRIESSRVPPELLAEVQLKRHHYTLPLLPGES